MATAILEATGHAGALMSLVDADGSGCADHVRALLSPLAPLRDLSDAVHALCVLHGIVPGLVDQARGACGDETLGSWLELAVATVAQERALLVRLAAAVGPMPSTPGQAASENAVMALRHALGMLARSDREGCATGAAIAFVLDWKAVRAVLDAAASRHGIAPDHGFDPLLRGTHAMLGRHAPSPGQARAMMFGAQQMLAQHRGLWHLLEARASARTGK